LFNENKVFVKLQMVLWAEIFSPDFDAKFLVKFKLRSIILL